MEYLLLFFDYFVSFSIRKSPLNTIPAEKLNETNCKNVCYPHCQSIVTILCQASVRIEIVQTFGYTSTCPTIGTLNANTYPLRDLYVSVVV